MNEPCSGRIGRRQEVDSLCCLVCGIMRGVGGEMVAIRGSWGLPDKLKPSKLHQKYGSLRPPNLPQPIPRRLGGKV